MNSLTVHEVLEFLDWLLPTLKIIERNNMFLDEREEVFKIAGELIEGLVKQIHRNYNLPPPPTNDPGSVQWLYNLEKLEDTREEKEK